MRCWGWPGRPWIATLYAAFAAVLIFADAGCLLGACPLPRTASDRPSHSFIDLRMHGLRLERFYARREIALGVAPPLAVRGVRGSTPHPHDVRPFTLADSAEIFNLPPGLKLTQAEDSIYDLSAHALRAS